MKLLTSKYHNIIIKEFLDVVDKTKNVKIKEGKQFISFKIFLKNYAIIEDFNKIEDKIIETIKICNIIFNYSVNFVYIKIPFGKYAKDYDITCKLNRFIKNNTFPLNNNVLEKLVAELKNKLSINFITCNLTDFVNYKLQEINLRQKIIISMQNFELAAKISKQRVYYNNLLNEINSTKNGFKGLFNFKKNKKTLSQFIIINEFSLEDDIVVFCYHKKDKKTKQIIEAILK